MPSYRDIVYGIYGALRLARLDPGAMSYFERTPAGFWKSFFAAVIVAPGFALIVAYELGQVEIELEAGALRMFLVETLAYVLGWAAFPVIVHQICEATGRRDAYIGYIVAFNWSKVIQMAVLLPSVGLIALGAPSRGRRLLLAPRRLVPDPVLRVVHHPHRARRDRHGRGRLRGARFRDRPDHPHGHAGHAPLRAARGESYAPRPGTPRRSRRRSAVHPDRRPRRPNVDATSAHHAAFR